ncbi:BnaCnng75010D, partial [Brassica napus]
NTTTTKKEADIVHPCLPQRKLLTTTLSFALVISILVICESYSGLVFKVPDITLHMIYMASYIGPGPCLKLRRHKYLSKTVDFSERIPTVKGPRTAVFWDAVDYPFPPSSTLSHQLLLKGILVIRLQSGPILMMMTRKGLPYWVTGRGLPESTFFPEGIKPLDVSE